MERDRKKQQLYSRPMAQEKAVICGKKYRFTVLTDCLIRMEYQEDGLFTDEPTQTVICREFPLPEFEVIESKKKLEIITKELHLYYDKKPFSSEGLFIGLKKGYTVWDDAKSAILTEDGWAAPRSREGADLYFFGYGHDYQRCLKDFYHLSGETPLLPKYVLGNWWSRFYPYTEETYLELMEKFREKNIPISVSVIDMDWHLTNVPKRYGSGWTGYTWNRELFPDPERFLQRLHKMGKRVTLNLHPADGVRAFEDAYLPMAKELGADYEQGEKIPFAKVNPGYVVLVIMSVIWLFPIVWILLTSFRAEKGYYVGYFIPKGFTFDNYINLFANDSVIPFGRWWMNTFIVAVVCCILNTIIILATAYVLSRTRFGGRTTIMKIMLIIGMFPGFMSMIAVYNILKGMGLAQTLTALRDGKFLPELRSLWQSL